MFFRICNLCCKNNASFARFPRHYAKSAASSRRKEIEETRDETRSQKERIPIIRCKNKSLNFYSGYSYSKKEAIPLASKGWNHRNARGDFFFIYPYNNDVDKEIEITPAYGSFKDFNLNLSICEHLESLDIKEPLEIQKLGIPKISDGFNTVLAAETGCGKTFAYLLPMINQILHWKQITQRNMNTPLGLIATPTRELAVQIALELIKLSKHMGIRTKVITGGKTKRMMREPPVDDVDVLVGSFGVLSKLTTVKLYKLDFVKFVVLDEADALFHPTFEDKVKVFMNRLPIGYLQETDEDGLPKTAQLVLASATMPSRLQQVLGNIVNLDSLEYVTTAKLHQILVLQKYIRIGPSQKPAELLKYVKPKVANNEPVIVFSNTNSTSYWLTLFLNEVGVKTRNLNGTMSLIERRGKYAEFLNGKAKVLSTTNAGSRGLDTVMVNHVLNYDFPLDTATYIHRCGRTGRVGTKGDCRVTNFISKPAEISLVQKIERAVRKKKPIPMISITEPAEEAEEPEPEIKDEYVERIIENVDNAEDIPY